MNYRETMSRLNRALNQIDSAYAAIAKKHGLTFNALMTLCLIAESDTVTQKQICEALHLPKSTVHSILFDFIKHGYVTLTTGSNKKEKFIVYTEIGSRHFSKILEETRLFEDKVLSALGDEACDFLVDTAERLGEMIKSGIEEISIREE